jgi:hypothetical protein
MYMGSVCPPTKTETGPLHLVGNRSRLSYSRISLTFVLTRSICLTTFALPHHDDAVPLHSHQSGGHADADWSRVQVSHQALPPHILPLSPEAPTPDPPLMLSS